jgi:hypothetical protein
LLKTVTAMNDIDASDDLQSQENTFEPDFEETLLEMMQSKLDGPHIPLANMTFLIVSYRPFLSLA